MGSGTSTWVRALLKVVAKDADTMGSPTFPLVQTYQAKAGFPIYHIDLYRLKNEAEIEMSGIESQIEEQGALVCVEWASLFESYFSYWLRPGRSKQKKVFVIQIEQHKDDFRSYQILELE